MTDVIASSHEQTRAPSGPGASSAPRTGAGVQLKSALAGHGYDVQRSMLQPAQGASPVEAGANAAPAQGSSAPVQRRAVQREERAPGAPPAPRAPGTPPPIPGAAQAPGTTAAPGAPAAPAAVAQEPVRSGPVPGAGTLEMLEANYNQACAAWVDQAASQSSALVDATVELQRLYVFYEAKYKAGSWRHRVMSIFKTPPATPPDASIVDGAVTKALAFQGAAASASRDRAGATAVTAAYEAAQMAHDAAWVSLEQYRANIGEASSTFWKNAGMKVAIGIGGAVVGIGAGAAVAAAAPAVGIGVVTAKIATAMIGSGVGGAFSGGVSSGVAQYKQEGEVKADQVVREAILQGSVGAAWSLLGGPLAALIGPLLPAPLQAQLGAKSAEYIMKAMNTGGGLALKGKIADSVRGKPDTAPFDANEIAYSVVQKIDIAQLAAEINAAYAAEQQANAAAPAPGAAPSAPSAPPPAPSAPPPSASAPAAPGGSAPAAPPTPPRR